jgi:hypothetical protein
MSSLTHLLAVESVIAHLRSSPEFDTETSESWIAGLMSGELMPDEFEEFLVQR